jgi:hypothetical protein
MKRTLQTLCFVPLVIAVWSGCSRKPAEQAAAPIPLDKIQGKAQTLIESSGATDAALNAGGPSIYLWSGLQRYRLFLMTPVDIVHGKQYVAEGVLAQKVIDDLGDPDLGKHGYPLDTSCMRVVKRAWPNLSLDAIDTNVALVRARVRRYPARPLLLVTQIRPATADEIAASPDAKAAEAAKNVPEIDVPAEKQKALLVEGSVVQPTPLWEPAAGTVSCKLVIGADGKVAELDTGKQLCEAVPWATFRYQPTLRKGSPVKVRTEVEVRFEPKKT